MNIVVYDIANPKRLQAVAKTCEKYLARVQKSVFEGEIGKAELHALQGDLDDIIDPAEDSVFIYTVPRVAIKGKIVMGKEPEHPCIVM